MTRTEHPAPGIVVVVDLENFSARTDPEQRLLRTALYDWLARAFGPLWTTCRHEDRGDGALLLWPETSGKRAVLAAVLRLARTAPPGPPTPRLRAAVHAGEVFRDDHGYVGDDVNRAFRLAQAAPLKQALREASGQVAVLVSGRIHDSVVRHRYPDIDPDAFHPVPSGIEGVDAWLHLPGESRLAARLAKRIRRRADAPAPTPPITSGVHFNAGRDITVGDNVTIAGKDITR